MNSVYTNWTYQVFKLKKDKVKKEKKYPGTFVTIPELRMTIRLKQGHTLESWIKNYCRTNPLSKDKLYLAYNIVE